MDLFVSEAILIYTALAVYSFSQGFLVPGGFCFILNIVTAKCHAESNRIP